METNGLTVLLKRFLISVGIILFVRIGSYLPVPGLDPKLLAMSIQTNTVAQNFVNTFSGNNTFVIGLFTLSIFPYINASIFVQLIIAFSPSLAKLQKEKDLSSQRSIIKLTRIITLAWAIIQSAGIGLYFKSSIDNWNFYLLFQIILWLTTGAMIILWFSELITDYGLGNGPSIFIYTNIAANFPNLSRIFTTEVFEKIDLNLQLAIGCLITFSLLGFVLLQNGIRKITIISSRELTLKMPESINVINSYIPLKLNQAGIIPIILTTTVLVLPGYISNSLGFSISLLPEIDIPNLKIFYKILYWSGYFGFILTFSSFYSTLTLNPKDISDQLQKTSATIPGCRPGLFTAFYLKKVMQRLNTLGSSILAILATFPNIIENFLNISSLGGLSSTSLLIMVGVLFDVTKEIDDIMYSSIYKEN